MTDQQRSRTICFVRAACAVVLASLVACLPIKLQTVQAQDLLPVDLALVLSIDCSYSVDMHEYNLQTRGTAWAFAQDKIKHAIKRGPNQQIAVSVVQWAGVGNQYISLPWTIVSSEADVDGLAQKIATMPRHFANGNTSLLGVMNYARGMLARAPFSALRKTMDISSDGRNNTGGHVRLLRDAIVSEGTTINGLAILNEVPTLNYYFEREIIGGVGSFVFNRTPRR